MKHLRAFHVLVIVALLLAGLTTPTFGQGPSPRGEPPAATPRPPPPTKESPPVPLSNAPAEPADAGVTGDYGIMALWPGADGYGYIGQTVSYNWVDITGSGTSVSLGDDDWDGPFSIGFTFPFYGINWTEFYIGSNGFISFGSGSSDFSNDCPLPNASTPHNIIALMWDDLDPGVTSDPVYYQSFGTCPIGSGACLVVQYENYHHWQRLGAGAIAGTFEAILFDNGDVIIQFEDAGAEQGSESTTGIENANAVGDYGLTYACGTAGSLSDNLAILYVPPYVPPCDPFTVFFDDFEGGYGNWAMTGLWNPEAETDTCGSLVAPFPSSANDAYYGIDGTCTYNNGSINSGNLEMVFDVPVAAATLNFWSYEDTECGGGNCDYDQRYVDVSTDGGATWSTAWGSIGPEGVWYPASANLLPFVGGPLRVRFRFETGDALYNDYFGWMVDDVEIVGCQPGWLEGHVMDSELLDIVPPCTDAVVHIEPGNLDVPADPATGYYGPVQLISGTYTLEATAPGFSVETAVVDITTGVMTTQDFNLWRPVVEVAPTDFISITAVISQPVTYTLTINDNGHLPLDFEIVDLPWVWEDPISGTIPGPGEIGIDVTFHCTEPRNYTGTLSILHNDPCEGPIDVPIVLHCMEPPEWGKWINGVEWSEEISVTVETSDTIEIVDVVSALQLGTTQQIQSLSGSNVQFDGGSQGYDFCYLPGASQTFCFRAESFTDDYEWVENLWVRFPSDWQVTNVWDNGPNVCDQGGTWAPFGWSYFTGNYEIQVEQEVELEPTDHCYTYYCFEVVSGGPGVPEDALESWYWEGDMYGDPPNNPCSDDGYTPSGETACDEAVNPQASIPPCASLLLETWNPEELALLDYEVSAGAVFTDTDVLEWTAPPGEPVTLTKWFHVQPCTWTETILWEELWFAGEPLERPVTITKLLSDLWIDSVYEQEVTAGEVATFTLSYGNDGGYETDVTVRNEFPEEAPFVSSDPPADDAAADGSWAEWDIGDLAMDDQGSIEVTVAVSDTLVPCTWITITDWIYDHLGDEADVVTITLHVGASTVAWEKLVYVNGVLTDTTPITVVPSDTVEIADRVWITYTSGITFTLVETWTESLDLDGWENDAGSVISGTNTLTWDVTNAAPNTWYAITKTLHVEEGEWLYDYITETLWVENADPQPGDRVLQFNYLSPLQRMYLPIMMKNATP